VDLEPSSNLIGSGNTTSFQWSALGITSLHVILGLILFEPTLFPGGDNAGYLILGDALRNGDGYRDLYAPGTPFHAKYPPVLPLLLAALGSVQISKFAMLICTSLIVLVTAHLGRRIVGDGPALLTALFLAVNPTLLEYGHYILSEAPFILLVVLALWTTESKHQWAPVLAMLAASGAFATRTAGLTILLALPISWLFHNDFRRAVIGGITALVALLGWGLYQNRVAPGQPSYLEELVLRDPYSPETGSVSIGELVARAANNLWDYVSRVVPQTVTGLEDSGTGLTIFFGFALCGLALRGWAARARRSMGPLEVFVLLYGGLIAIWPEVWTDRRFFLPLLPMIFLLSVWCLGQIDVRFRRWVFALTAVFVLLPCIVWITERAPSRIECTVAFMAGAPCDPPAYASLYEAARWARDNTAPGAVIANRKPRLFFWYSQRKGDVYPYSTNTDVVLEALDRMGADYVVVDQVSGTTGQYLIPAIQANQSRFEPVYQGGTPPTLILRILPSLKTAQ
jgi:hypothetical protein